MENSLRPFSTRCQLFFVGVDTSTIRKAKMNSKLQFSDCQKNCPSVLNNTWAICCTF